MNTVHHTQQYTLVYGTSTGHILADAGQREVKLLENWNIMSFA